MSYCDLLQIRLESKTFVVWTCAGRTFFFSHRCCFLKMVSHLYVMCM